MSTDTALAAVPEPRRADTAMTPLAAVLRAAADPDTDADKLGKLYDIADRHQRREAEIAFSDAMCETQAEMSSHPVIKNRENKQTKSDYADLGAVLKVLRPIYTKHGFSVSLSTVEPILPNTVRVKGILRHRQGHMEEHFYDNPYDNAGINGSVNKTPTHAFSSSTSYAQRILNMQMFNLYSGYDDDGNAAGGQPINPDEEKANNWIERATKVETPQQYEKERAAMMKDYGAADGGDAAIKKIPGGVKRSFAEAKNAVMPRDEEHEKVKPV